MALSPNLAVMERAIEKASRSLSRDFNEVEKLQISVKGPGDFVSRADKRSEEIIVECLQKDRPDWGIMAEEGTAIRGKDERYRFIVDPLDGTRNFLHGLPHWCVTIALEKDGDIVAGMTYDPMRDEMFRVEKGTGAFMNTTRLRVSGRKDLNVSLVVLDSNLYDDASAKAFQQIYGKVDTIPGMTTRTMGAVALDLAYAAAGRYDAYYFQGGAKPWDVATGMLLVREAGGVVTNLTDLKTAEIHNGAAFLAANPTFHKKMADFLK